MSVRLIGIKLFFYRLTEWSHSYFLHSKTKSFWHFKNKLIESRNCVVLSLNIAQGPKAVILNPNSSRLTVHACCPLESPPSVLQRLCLLTLSLTPRGRLSPAASLSLSLSPPAVICRLSLSLSRCKRQAVVSLSRLPSPVVSLLFRYRFFELLHFLWFLFFALIEGLYFDSLILHLFSSLFMLLGFRNTQEWKW